MLNIYDVSLRLITNHHLFSASNSPNLTTGDPEREQLAF